MIETKREQYDLRYLFFVMTSVAVAAWLVSPQHDTPSLSLIGMGIFLFWIARGMFSLSKRGHVVLRRTCFFVALVFYLLAITSMLRGVFFFVGGWIRG